ncbi:MAG: FAD-binding protein [Clostridium cadaveris]|uniref:Electron transfer flavoprotein alpha subunit apoprotein n=1 Tax=Clostridium cadaveris TaxID=1529 RepID=A0A1I2LXV5_9CLOT|nr:electron transfer flavoprotein subunit alpha [Clostridium cadaveris]MDU4951123.1 FAD-binding protein [Clostridium sp.]MDM8312997.1 FAD-binding protein [Clostridium cadaveris]MDY4948837.1 FAD-binding protein [Clostridium cadaveris]NME63077.1 electron transfer flavoprotein subunit alpha [Clostridium cadaveris]PWL52247.1 MAG: electron transfer flavoprotein subunit alpha [Clostridium cadaveris]
MGKLIINQDKVQDIKKLIDICPFGAMEEKDGHLEINSNCKMCRLCVKNGAGAVEFIEEKVQAIDKSKWQGIAVYVDHVEGNIHPVTFELIGKAKELAKKINQKVYCLFIGYNIKDKAEELLHYGVDEVMVYDKKELEDFRIEPYTFVFSDFINKVKPSSILVGATTVGRSLAPRVAARFRTGLTADCTVLDVKENSDLVQIRPAFGGNIMAQINTPNSRPQMATVRYKVMSAPSRQTETSGHINFCDIDSENLTSGIEVKNIIPKEKEHSISEAEVIVAAGRGVKSEKDMAMIRELAQVLNAELGATRPLIESGWIDAKNQIGLSGKTVRPKLIIACGISGAVQFAAGMNNSDYIFAINKDPKASIFKIAHYGIVGDIYDIIPKLINEIKSEKEA